MTKNQFAAVVVCATILLGFLAYANTFAGDWVWDDVSSESLHENVQQPEKIFSIVSGKMSTPSAGAEGNFYRPLVSASFMLDFWSFIHPYLTARN